MNGIRASIEYLNAASENRLTIIPPVGKILSAGAWVFLCQLFLLAGTNQYTCIFTIPMFLYWGIAYGWFWRIWTAFYFSKVWIISVPVLILPLSVCCHWLFSYIT